MQKAISQNATLTNSATQLTKTLLACGVVAGPLFTVVGLIQAFTRPGFDLSRHALSLLENGDLGWMEIATFLLSGLLFVAGAIGMRQVLRGSRGGTWGPILIGAVGAGLIGAGCFTADPGLGFPPGTSASASAISWHGLVHMMVSSLSFLALIAACCVFARRLVGQRQRGWAAYALVSGVLCFVAFAGLATGHLWMTSAFVFTMLNAYVWISVMAAKLLPEQPHTPA
ncbi:DUF998 domain-containing protein [Ktedonobacter racemifer]|uniref:DUF998 domain-containing protein n=1 Tax=Ktedonobacter racemifer DSM 44963 TaxID=485913 RepID=D6U7J7_KTERA|nr:DUF998 domain-containing protein [Ktedonobacter racemifer]EFH79858.1 conserved hypothetical protein [Ktedonobacter racemifer DSM 44963]